MPRIEAADFGGNCNRTTGAGCTNPPPNANFYPIYSTQQSRDGTCRWNLGGPFIPGTTNSFGGSSTTEYTAFYASLYPGTSGPVYIIENYHQVLRFNPCPNRTGDQD
jgi:hypothetical protein